MLHRLDSEPIDGQGQDYKWRPGGGEDTPVDGPATILSNSNQWKLLHIVVK